MSDLINHPPHYKADNGIEAIDVVEGFGLNFRIGNAVTYLLRADRKGEPLKDLRKARWYVDREIDKRGGRADVPDDPLYYLATPYSKFAGGIHAAFEAAAKLTARLIRAGHKVYSPIAHTHPAAIHGGLDPLDHALWLPFDEAMMERSDVLLVAQMPGWRESFGIAHEIAVFQRAGKRIEYLDCDTLMVSAHPLDEGVAELVTVEHRGVVT